MPASRADWILHEQSQREVIRLCVGCRLMLLILSMKNHIVVPVKHVNDSGQTVVIILLVAVVAATIAFSIAGSSLKNIEQTATTEETNRAFSAAEAGNEE